jgi:hypothetical protein
MAVSAGNPVFTVAVCVTGGSRSATLAVAALSSPLVVGRRGHELRYSP